MRVYHFNNGSGGGVLSVIKNLIEHSVNPEVENHIIYTINKDKTPEFTIPKIKGAASVRVFYFSPNWNFWYTCKQLAKLIPDDKAVLVAHDWLELGMASHLGLQNPIVQFLHGDYAYYYQLAEKHEQVVDCFACVSPVISEKAKLRLSESKNHIYHTPFPVPEVPFFEKQRTKKLRVLFCVRDLNDDSKQFSLLSKIQEECGKVNTDVQWTIIGSGKTDEQVKELLGEDTRYFQFLKNEQVIDEMNDADILVHPSLIEGFPIVVVEAMKAGVVPLINDWDGSTESLVIEGNTGFYFKPGDAEVYAQKIVFLNQHPDLLNEISINAREKAESLFDPFRNTETIEDVYHLAAKRKISKVPKKVYGSRLDKKWIPNWFVLKMRS